MGFFSRLFNVISGFFNSLIGNVEAKNPELVYANAIQDRLKQQKELKKAVSGIVFLRNKTEKELAEKEGKLSEVDDLIDTALMEGDEELAIQLEEERVELEAKVETLRAELERCRADADTAMEQLNLFTNEIKKLKREKETMVAKAKTAEARQKISETLDGLSVDADTQALANVRESIEKKVAEADISAEMKENSFESRMAKLKAKSGSSKARRSIAERKARLAAQRGASSSKRNI